MQEMKCKCCDRVTNDLRFGFCFDCATAESIIAEGIDMFDEPIAKQDGMSLEMSKVKAILKRFNIKGK